MTNEEPVVRRMHIDDARALAASATDEGPRLIAPCPDCGDEFDVTDEDGRLRSEAHWERHHARLAASATDEGPRRDANVEEALRLARPAALLDDGACPHCWEFGAHCQCHVSEEDRRDAIDKLEVAL